ncbi:MAG: hypothetical protein IT373_03285 [Polyangiaceae bacterium]|nr:hypothetical protein [Polyangiaceae bacterium]
MPKRHASLFALVGAAGLTGLATELRADPPVDATAELTADVAGRIAARYGHPGRCRRAERAGWEGYPVRRCRYAIGGVTAEVELLDVGPARIARWIVGACRTVGAAELATCAEKLRRHVELVSSYLFPVAGVVLEDLDPTEPGVEGYAFRDGVTVKVEGFDNGKGGQPTDAAIAAALHAPPREAMRYARLQSTTREQYRKNGGTVDVGTSAAGERKLAWLEVVRASVRAAWDAPSHELMVAWARAHAAELGAPAE